MALTAVRPTAPAPRLDYSLLRRVSFAFAVFVVAIAPLSPDPLAFAAGGVAPWVILRLIGTPTMPSAVAFYLLAQWLQVFARALIGLINQEPFSMSIEGAWVADAYWYMLASTLTLAFAFKIMLGGVPPPSQENWTAHLHWRPVDVFMIYLGSIAFVQVAGLSFGGSAYQFFEAASRFKIMAAFLLFTSVMSVGRGWVFMFAVIGIEIFMGMSALLGDFRGVFVFLGTAALAARIRWTVKTTNYAAASVMLLVFLGLFWTSVKGEYREIATGGTESQALRLPIEERVGYMLGRVLSVGDIDWTQASELLLQRIAYVDIFGLVIAVDQNNADQGTMRQWNETFAHVFQPRVLFPDKQVLSDVEVFIRLTHSDVIENIRGGTSISVGYMAENYVDLGFPGMLAGIFALGLVIAGIVRYFMSIPVPWMVREGTAMAFLYALGATGVEISLPKLVGSIITFFVVYGLAMKFIFPVGHRWLEARAQRAEDRETLLRRIKGLFRRGGPIV